MGKVITFYSPYRGTGVSALASLTAVYMAHKSGKFAALTQTPGRDRYLEEGFDENIPSVIAEEVYMKSGLWSLWQRFRQSRLSASDIRLCALKTGLDNLDLFPCSSDNHPDEKTYAAICSVIMNEMGKAYEICFVDAGDETPDTTKEVFYGSDAIVCVLPQSERQWKKLLLSEEVFAFREKMIFVTNSAIKESCETKSLFERTISKNTGKKNGVWINANACIRDLHNYGRFASFFKKSKSRKDNEIRMDAIKDIKCLSEMISEVCKLNEVN